MGRQGRRLLQSDGLKPKQAQLPYSIGVHTVVGTRLCLMGEGEGLQWNDQHSALVHADGTAVTARKKHRFSPQSKGCAGE